MKVTESIEESNSKDSPNSPVSVEFAGWLPAFKLFGNCGNHPQFSHIRKPPDGYEFVSSEQPLMRRSRILDTWNYVTLLLRGVAFFIWLLFRPFTSVLRNGVTRSPIRSAKTLIAVIRLYFKLRRHGGRVIPVVKFLRSRHFPSQVLLPTRPRLLFLTSVPYTFGQHPWVVEIEDITTLFFPLVCNGETADTDIRESPYFPILKTMLEDDACRGIITHMRSTAQALPRVFGSDVIGRKTTYIPCGTSLPDRPQEQKSPDAIHMLFTCSWHQNPDSLFLRGGLEVLRAFEILHERYPNLRLTIRTNLPRLRRHYRRIIDNCWVRVIDRFLSDEEMDELMRDTQIFLLPSARIHVVSTLRAMAYGQVVVASDGWGFEEYIDHGRNGLIVYGRRGKISWEHEETGMLCEDYRLTRVAHPVVVRNLVDAVSTLVEDGELRRCLGQQARRDVATQYNLENWNRGLKLALDRALRPNQSDVSVDRIQTEPAVCT